uniref:Uncharacterized protein n=1 Tax=Rangifer tarandus platyrhynchus TaxID=3082113 RepID=A0ACB0FBD2_RANTA|nr:unnamed protein product [Rangifer tarandus platyrhynchus]
MQPKPEKPLVIFRVTRLPLPHVPADIPLASRLRTSLSRCKVHPAAQEVPGASVPRGAAGRGPPCSRSGGGRGAAR